MTCFTAWLVPKKSLIEAAKQIGAVFGVSLVDGETTAYDEYPAYEVECADDDEGWFITLLGIPPDLEYLISQYPSEFDDGDRNYSFTICTHKGLPVSPETGLDLPWSTDSELAQGLIERLHAAGFEFYEGKLPYTRSEGIGLVRYPVK